MEWTQVVGAPACRSAAAACGPAPCTQHLKAAAIDDQVACCPLGTTPAYLLETEFWVSHLCCAVQQVAYAMLWGELALKNPAVAWGIATYAILWDELMVVSGAAALLTTGWQQGTRKHSLASKHLACNGCCSSQLSVWKGEERVA
eukprot:scaffold68841_cov23-Tisochrysis_lutea.AAC.2